MANQASSRTSDPTRAHASLTTTAGAIQRWRPVLAIAVLGMGLAMITQLGLPAGAFSAPVGGDSPPVGDDSPPVAGGAVLDVRIEYPDGSLVDDRNVCLNFYGVSDDQIGAFFAGGSDFPVGATPSYTQFAPGTRFAMSASGCFGAERSFSLSVWHNGVHGSSHARDYLVPPDAIVLEPGQNSVTVTIGQAELSGVVTAPHPRGCRVTATGDNALSSAAYDGTLDWAYANADGSYVLHVPPGDYVVETRCYLLDAYQAWDGASLAGDATVLTVAHGDVVDGIDFDVTDDYGDFTTGTLFHVPFNEQADADLPKCFQVERPNGTVVSNAAFTVDNGDYLLQIIDCHDLGFTDFWYPSALTRDDAQVLTVVTSESVDTYLEPIDLVRSGGDELLCNGHPVTIRGTAGDDVLIGTPGRDVIHGLRGDDVIRGLEGDDVICAGGGNDRVYANQGDDWIDAGAGADEVGAGSGDDTVFGRSGGDLIYGYGGADLIIGGGGDDVLIGGAADDDIRGGAGNDVIAGQEGNDRLVGNAGADEVRGGHGADRLGGGSGADDSLSGGDGWDVCHDLDEATNFDCEIINSGRHH